MIYTSQFSSIFVLQAANDFNIDLSLSIMIGASDNDAQAGDAGCRLSIKCEGGLTPEFV